MDARREAKESIDRFLNPPFLKPDQIPFFSAVLHDSGGVWCCKPFLHSQIGFLPGAVFFLND